MNRVFKTLFYLPMTLVWGLRTAWYMSKGKFYIGEWDCDVTVGHTPRKTGKN